MTVNGKQDDFTLDDFKACARSASMKRGRAEAIVEEVVTVVVRWPDYADYADVLTKQRDSIQETLRLKLVD